MKVTIPEIAWHNRDPVFSADFSLKDGAQWRMATAGADSDVKMWRVVPHRDGKDTDIIFLSNLRRHTNTVNCVRFSPNGLMLASGGDDGAMFLWHEREDKAESTMFDEDTEQNKEHWVAFKMLRGHIEDVMDLSWSPDCSMIISGSIDNSAIIWEIKTGKKLHLLKEHSHYVQGVTWDPLGYYVCSLSSDRSMLVYEAERGNLICNVTKYHTKQDKKPDPNNNNPDNKTKSESKLTNRMFVEEGATKYFRRLDFTPDGAFLIVPAGQRLEKDDMNFTTLLFSRANFKRPVCHLPGPQKPVCAVRCCPVLYNYRNPGRKQKTELPYRMVYAVASLGEVYVYDTEQFAPLCTVADIHYACITDLAWSSNGRVLMITSYDGFCTILSFDQDELGTLYTEQAAQINSPRMTIKPQSKTKKKKKQKSPKSVKNGENNENVSPMQVEKPKDTEPESKPMETEHIVPTTPIRPNGMDHTLQTSLNNKLLTPSKDLEPPIKRITPIKVTEVVHNRENPANMIVIDSSDNSNDCTNIKPTEIKPTKRIALTKVE